MLLVIRLFDSLPLVTTHDQHDEDMARHQLKTKRIVKCIGRSHGGGEGAGGRGRDSSKSSPVSGQLLVYHCLVEKGVCYLAVCMERFSKKKAFDFLEADLTAWADRI